MSSVEGTAGQAEQTASSKPRRYNTTTPCKWGESCRYLATRTCRFVHPHPGGRFSVIHIKAGAVTEISSYLDKFTAIEKFNMVLPSVLSAEQAAKAVVFAVASFYYVGVGNDVWMLTGVHIHDMSTFVRLPSAPVASVPEQTEQ